MADLDIIDAEIIEDALSYGDALDASALPLIPA